MGRTVARTPFGTWLRAELDARDWGVRTLARRMNGEQPEIARRALNRYLYEGAQPSDATRTMIASALGVSPDELPADEEGDPG